ncbi:hypothetical protein N7507_005868 [Penicillium longicatenatum]|nr:hypothetical protein N7507_005868 [Penicillium longicatenatum]
MSKPSIIFAPGAWYPPTAFDPLISKLTEYTCYTCAFPSVQQAASTKDLKPDIEAVRSLVQREVDAGRDVLVVSHSWSGVPVNSALDGLSKIEREQENKKGGVVRLAFISAFLAEIGESLISAFGGQAPDWHLHDVEKDTVMAADPVERFLHDVPDGEEWAKKLGPHSWFTKRSPASSAAYLTIPSSYLLCEDDKAIPLAVQQWMIERAREKGAQFETETIATGHTPWLVRTDEVATYIRRQAGEDV